MSAEELFDKKTRNRIVMAAFGLLMLATLVDWFDRTAKQTRARALAAQAKVVEDLSPRGAVIADVGVALLDAVTPDRPRHSH
jgi:hypothetical protein